jgi:hypothetical protein
LVTSVWYPSSWYSNDVKEWEVKARKEGFKTLYNWLENEREQPDALAIKTDRKPGLVVMLLDTFLKMVKE